MAEIINGVPIGDLPGIESVPDDSMLVVEFLGKAYHMPGAVLRQMIQDVLDSMGDSVDDVTEARLTAAIETVLASGKYNGVSPSVEVLDEEDGTSVIHIIDAFGVKKYPVEVKGARNAVQYVEQELTEEQKAQARENIGIGEIGNSVVVELSGNPTDGYTALLSGEAVTGDELDEMAKNGSHITGVATESLVFQVSNGINGTSYTVPNGTIFSYGNAIVTGNPGFYGTGGVHSFEFRVCLQDYNFAIAYKAVANQDEKVWVSATQATHMVFRLGISRGIPAVLYGTQMLYGNSVPNMNYLYTILAESQLLNRPVFCYQVNMPFYTDDGTEMTPYSGVLFSLKINSAYQYFFEAEHEGYVYRFTVKQNEGYSCTAEPTELYKKVQSKADDLKEEDGTLFLLSAGKPIGAGVPLPTGNADDCKIFIADLNTSTYEDIKAADDAGKICYAFWGGYTPCMLTTLSGDSAIFTTLLDPHLGKYVKFTKGTVGVSDFGLTESHSVLYEPQSLTDAQKAQARENIGALAADDIDVDSIGSNVFVADYDTTTFAEVKAAHDAGKVCFVKSDGMPFCQLLGITDSEAIFVREVNDTTDYKVTFTSAGGKDFTLVDKNTPIYVAQTLSDAQKAQARTNIGAAAASDIAATKYASTSTANTSYFKISDFGSWGTGAWYQKGFSMLITSRAGETVWFSLSANDSATTARAFRLMNTYSKIAGVYYSVSENAVYVKAAGWCNNVTAHILSNIGGDYVPTVASVSGLASDAVEVNIIEFGPASSGLAVGGSSTPLLLGGSATRPTYNGADMALSSDLSGYLPTTGTAARATADANGNNIANTYANKNVGNTFDGEQKMVNSSYAPTMNDIAGGVGCSLKNARACDNQLIVAEIFAPTTAATDSTINMNAVVGEIGFYHGGSGNGGQFSDKMQLARITSAGIYEGSTLLSDKYLAKSGTAAKAAADGNGNNIVSTYFPKSGGKFSGPISFDSASLPSKNLEYICGIDAFANGGQMGWQSKADFLSGCLSTNYVSTGITGGYGSIRLNTNNGGYYGLETAEGDRWMFNGTYCGFYNKYNQWPLILENCSTVDATLHVSKIGTGWGQDKHVEFVNGITAPALNVTGGAYISGRYFGGGDDEGLVIGRANNNYAGLTLGSHTGVRSTFYLMPDNSAVWRYNNGSTSYDIRHPGKAGTIALTDDVIEAANGALKVTLSGTSVDKTLAQIETALNAGRHVYMAENDGLVYQLSMHMAGMMACFTSVVTSGTQVTVTTVIVYDGIEPSVLTKTL